MKPIALQHPLVSQAHSGLPLPLVRAGLLHSITPHEIQALRDALAHKAVPPDLEMKLGLLAKGDLVERFVAQNSRLFIALLHAVADGSFGVATPAEHERLLRVLAYVRKDDDEIPDYKPRGFFDDQQEVRAAVTELSPLLQTFKAWRLTHQVPQMW